MNVSQCDRHVGVGTGVHLTVSNCLLSENKVEQTAS